MIKNLHLGVYPPNGRVRVAAPLAVTDENIRLAVIGKLGWIRRQQARFEGQSRQSPRELVSGESHYYLGQRYRLRVVFGAGPAKISFPRKRLLELRVAPGTGIQQRDRALQGWYRGKLRELATPLLALWEDRLGVNVADWGIKRMKTRWVTCNPEARRIWLNLELVKKPMPCLEYILVHELIHLLERHHNDRFTALMDRHLPQWRRCREQLNSEPLANEDWFY